MSLRGRWPESCCHISLGHVPGRRDQHERLDARGLARALPPSARAAAAAPCSRPCWSRRGFAGPAVRLREDGLRLLQPAADRAVLEPPVRLPMARIVEAQCRRRPAACAHSARAEALVLVISDLKPAQPDDAGLAVARCRLDADRRCGARPRRCPTVRNCGCVRRPSYEALASAGERARWRTSRPTILQIIPQLDTGGAELSAVEIAEAIVRAGGRALVLARAGGRLARHRRRPAGEIVPLSRRHQEPAAHAGQCARASARIVAQPRASISCTPAAARRPGAPCGPRGARACRSSPPITAPTTRRTPLKRLYNSVMARGDVVIANSRYTARPDRRRATARRASASRSSIAASTRDASIPHAIAADARRGAARDAGALRPDQPRHPAGGAADGLEGAGRADRGRRQPARGTGLCGTPWSCWPATRRVATAMSPQLQAQIAGHGLEDACASSAMWRTCRPPSSPPTLRSSPPSSRRPSAGPRSRPPAWAAR